MPALTTNGRVSIAFFASPLDVCLNFLYANFSDRQTFEERVELVHAEEAFFDTAVFGLPMIEAGWSICAVVIQQDTLQVFVAVTDRTVFPRRCQLIFLADSRIPMPLDRPTVLTEQASGIGYSPV